MQARIRSIVTPLAAMALAAGVAAQNQERPSAAQDGSAAAQNGQAQRAPKFVLETPVVDFGRILDTEEVAASIVFRNAGNAPLKIPSVNTTCGCTAAEMATDTLAPGESYELEVRFNPIGKRAGTNEQTVTIRTNDRENPVVPVKVRATIRPVVNVEPMSLNMGRIAKATRKDTLITLTGLEEDFEAYAVTVVGEGSRYFQTEIIGTMTVQQDGEPVRRTDILVSLTENAPPGRAQAMAVIRTNAKQKRIVNVPLAAEVQGDVVINPLRMSLGAIEAGNTLEEAVEVRHAKGKPFRITGVTLEPLQPSGLESAPIDFELEPLDDDQPADQGDRAQGKNQDENAAHAAYRLRLRLPAFASQGRVRGNLIVHTDVALEEKVELPYVGRVRQARAGE